MPYIKANYREHLDNSIVYLTQRLQEIPEEDRAGALNYTLTRLGHAMCKRYDLSLGDPPVWNYRGINEFTGVLECVKQEMYRRVFAPYEDTKIAESGDVLEFTLRKRSQDEQI
jgi:hypothetical protein